MISDLYVPKPNTWFKENTLVLLLDNYRPDMDSGLFLGTRVVENEQAENRPIGTEHLDEEVCSFDEFDKLEDTYRI